MRFESGPNHQVTTGVSIMSTVYPQYYLYFTGLNNNFRVQSEYLSDIEQLRKVLLQHYHPSTIIVEQLDSTGTYHIL